MVLHGCGSGEGRLPRRALVAGIAFKGRFVLVVVVLLPPAPILDPGNP